MASNSLEVRPKIAEIEALHVNDSQREAVRLSSDSGWLLFETILRSALGVSVAGISVVELIPMAMVLANVIGMTSIILGIASIVGGTIFAFGNMVEKGYDYDVSAQYRDAVISKLNIDRYNYRNDEIWVSEPRYRDKWNPVRLIKPMVLGQSCRKNGHNGSYTITTVRGSAFRTSVSRTTHLTDRGLFNETIKKLESNRKSGK